MTKIMKDEFHMAKTRRRDHAPLTVEDAVEITERLFWDIKGIEVGYSVVMNRIITNSRTLEEAIQYAEMIHKEMCRQLTTHFDTLKDYANNPDKLDS